MTIKGTDGILRPGKAVGAPRGRHAPPATTMGGLPALPLSPTQDSAVMIARPRQTASGRVGRLASGRTIAIAHDRRRARKAQRAMDALGLRRADLRRDFRRAVTRISSR